MPPKTIIDQGLPLSKNKGTSGCTPGNPCKLGEGDCDKDSDCIAGLKCF